MDNITTMNMAPSAPLSYNTRMLQARFIVVFVFTVVSYIWLLVGGHRGGKKSVPSAASRPPPSPRGLPLIGNLHQLGSLPHRSLRSLASAHGAADVMLVRLGQVPAVVVSSASAAREVLQAQDHVFASRPSLTIPRRLLYGCTDIAFAPHGAYWRGARKMSVRHLLSPPRVRAYRAVREQEVEALVRRVLEQAAVVCRGDHGDHGGGGVVRVSEFLSDFAKDVAGRIVLGLRAAGDHGWRAKVDALLEESNVLLAAFHVGDFIPWLSWVSYVDGTDARVTRAFERIDRILDEIVDAAAAATRDAPPLSGEEASDDDAFIHVLLSLQQEEPSPAAGTGECRPSRDNVKALLEDLFGAGTETTIIVLEWAMAELLRNKGVMQKLQREVRQAARSTGSDDGHDSNIVSEHDLAGTGMEYLRAVIKETMRLHTPGPLLLPHKSMQATRIGDGYDVASGTMVIVNAWAIGRDPEAWESPEEFRPERFVGSGSGVDFRGQHFQLIPFGAGRRMCPGVNLAMSVVELALANLVARFDWALPEGEAAELNMEETTGCTARKKAPPCAVATQRCF